jgi:restriction system protein
MTVHSFFIAFHIILSRKWDNFVKFGVLDPKPVSMPIPDYQSQMLPILETVSDKMVYKISEVRNILAERFHLTPDQRRELLPSGTQPVFDNRVAWAKTYLVKAQLLEAPKRAHIAIAQRGKEILKQNPDSINIRFL